MRFFLAAIIAVCALSFDFNLPTKWFRQNDRPKELVLAEQRSVDIVLRGTIDEVAPSSKLFVQPLSASDEDADYASQSGVEKQGNEEVSSRELMMPPPDFCSALKDAAEHANIPIAFFARLLWQESRFQSNEVSSAGAQGIAQFMPATAAEVGLQNPFDPLQALPASARLLRRLHNEFGNLGLAAAAYNAGSGRIRKWLSRTSPLPRETQNYVRIITGTAAEDWSAESKTIALRMQLPDAAPCEGVGGLSKDKGETIEVQVALNPSVGAIKRTADDQYQQKIENAKLLIAVKVNQKISQKRSLATIAQRVEGRTRSLRFKSQRSVAMSEPDRVTAKPRKLLRVASAGK